MDFVKAKEYGSVKLEINILVILVEIVKMALDNIIGQTEINIKASFVKI